MPNESWMSRSSSILQKYHISEAGVIDYKLWARKAQLQIMCIEKKTTPETHSPKAKIESSSARLSFVAYCIKRMHVWALQKRVWPFDFFALAGGIPAAASWECDPRERFCRPASERGSGAPSRE
jgi:hypothetical protein